MKKTLLIALALTCASTFTATAIPVTLAGFPGGGTWYEGGGGTVGFEFTANSSLSVIELGIYDYAGNGLYAAHTVGLWDTSGNLLVSATIPSATSAPLVGGYRWITATAAITAGSNYIVAAEYHGAGESDYFQDTAAINPLFSLVRDRYVDDQTSENNPGLVFPTQTYRNNSTFGWYGPNLRAQEVPDGGTTLVLLGGALTGLAALRRKLLP